MKGLWAEDGGCDFEDLAFPNQPRENVGELKKKIPFIMM